MRATWWPGATTRCSMRRAWPRPGRTPYMASCCPHEVAGSKHVWHQYVIRSARRDALRQFLAERKIGSEIYYPVPLHLQEALKCLGYSEGSFPGVRTRRPRSARTAHLRRDSRRRAADGGQCDCGVSELATRASSPRHAIASQSPWRLPSDPGLPCRRRSASSASAAPAR